VLTTVQKIGPVLDLFSIKNPEWGISEVAAELDIPKSSAHALLITMAELGLLKRTTRARYRLGWRLLVLGRTVMLSAEPLRPVAMAMKRTAERWGDSMHFAVYERGSVVCVKKAEGRHSVSLGTSVGMRLPAHATAVGKMLLAACAEPGSLEGLSRLTTNTITEPVTLELELAVIRQRGVAFDDEESLREISCVAAPVWGAGGLVGAISFAAATERLRRRRDAYAEEIVEMCDQLSREFGAVLPARAAAAVP
jgi:DNA-binding IclR family transcriptional regulator